MTYTKVVDEDIHDIIERCGVDCFQKLKNKTFLVTGASGMIGSYFIYVLMKLNELYNLNITIIPCVRNEKKLDPLVLSDSFVKLYKHDVTQPFDIEDKVDYILHAASPASPKIMKEKPYETNLANTMGAANTINLAIKNNVDRYMFVSSREIYGQPNEGQEIFTEDGPLGQVNPLVPRNGYAEGKKAAENMCVSAKEEYGINTKIVRLAHTYGPGMSINDGRVQADFLKNVVNHENIVLKSDGSSIRTYTYIADVITGMFMVLLNSKDNVYNIAEEGNKTSIKELAETLVDINPDDKLELVFDIPQNAPKGTAAFTMGIVSADKIKKELGWEAKYNIRDGFARTVDHLNEELGFKKTRRK